MNSRVLSKNVFSASDSRKSFFYQTFERKFKFSLATSGSKTSFTTTVKFSRVHEIEGSKSEGFVLKWYDR